MATTKKKYSPRTTAPSHSSKYYYSNDNIYHASGVGIYHKKDGKYGYYGNCTGYAWGRMWEITGIKPSSKWCGDPKGMYNTAKAAGYSIGKTPKLGSFIVFEKGSSSHIAEVVDIAINLDLGLGQSAWNRVEFELNKVTKASNYTYADGWKFVGFIYPNVELVTNKTTEQTKTTEQPKTNTTTNEAEDYTKSKIANRFKIMLGTTQKAAYTNYTLAVNACNNLRGSFIMDGTTKKQIYPAIASNTKSYQCDYTVKRGDTLWAIAAKYLGKGNRWIEIKSLNDLNSSDIRIGQKLKIPNK